MKHPGWRTPELLLLRATTVAAAAACAAAALLLGSCNVSLRDLDLPPASGKSTLTLLPSSVNLKTGESTTFTVAGGKTPYIFAASDGTIVPNEATAEYTAPTTAGTYIVTVTDANSNSTEATVMATASIPLSVNPTIITVTVGTIVTLVANGGNDSYDFIPPGTGILTHVDFTNTAAFTSTVPGDVYIEVNSGPETVFTRITSTASTGLLQISPSSVSLTTGQQLTFTASGGTGPYAYTVVPPGTGTIDPDIGLFTAPVVEESCTVRVSDIVSGTSEATVDVYYPLTIVPTDVSVVEGGTYRFTASGGKSPYTYVADLGSFVGDVYTAPVASGSDTVWVEDALHNRSYATIHVFDPSSYWGIHSVDTELKSGQYASLALDSDEHPHVAYYETMGKELRLASWDGFAWSSQVVDGTTAFVGQYASLALDPMTEYPRISYYDGDPRNRDLRYAVWDGTSWSWEVVDKAGNVGQYTSLALDPTTGHPRISYHDATGRNLKYAAWNGAAWEVSVVDEAGYVGKYSSLALDPTSGWPRIAYYDETNTTLKYAAWDGGSWQVGNPDAAPNRGEYCSLAVDGSGNPHISYYAADTSALRYAWHNGSTWASTEVDGTNDRGMHSAIALDASGRPRISYYDSTLKKLVFASNNGSPLSWTIIGSIDPASNVGTFTSLRMTSGGKAVIACYASSVQDLKVAVQP